MAEYKTNKILQDLEKIADLVEKGDYENAKLMYIEVRIKSMMEDDNYRVTEDDMRKHRRYDSVQEICSIIFEQSGRGEAGRFDKDDRKKLLKRLEADVL